jgi:alkylation response protein AidB-like acyl-CoA dehydrogenase
MTIDRHITDLLTSTLAGTASDKTKAEAMIADIKQLAPSITARIEEIEAGRRLPLDLVKTLRQIGIYRMFVAQSHGGLEFDFPTAIAIIGALCKIDGSVGWTAGIGSTAAIFASWLPRETYDKIYQASPDSIIAGSIQPSGVAERVASGWRISGSWPFASGCQHADWMFGQCVMTEGGKPLSETSGVTGPPMIRGFFLPARDWTIEDTWHVSGLKGTGSHHISLKDTVVPEANFFDLKGGAPCLPGALYQAVLQQLPVMHGGISVGIAEGALDELLELANTGRQQSRAAVPMKDSETFQGELGRIHADVRAAKAFIRVQAESHWEHALARELKTDALFSEGTQSAIWLATTCVSIADACFVLGGGSALYNASPLQRRSRDLHAAAQHAVAHQRHYASTGKLLLNGKPL